MHTHWHMHTHTCAQEHPCASITLPEYAEERLLRLKIYTQNTETHVYTCMRIPTHVHMHTYMHVHTHTYIHIHNTHIQHVHMHARKHAESGTMALQRLREEPDLTPQKLRTSPFEVVVPPPFNEIRSTRNDG